MKTIVTILFLISLNSCARNTPVSANLPSGSLHIKLSADVISTPCAQGLAAFEKNLYTPILRQQCVECHDVGGPGPAHSTADPVASYNMIKTYIDFTQSFDQSTIVSMVQAKHWLNYDKTATGVTVDQMMAALQAWWDQGENSCPSYATAQTTPLTIPSNLPLSSDGTYIPVSWALDSLGPDFAGSQFEVEIQQLVTPTSTTAGAYQLRNPRIATPLSGLSITGIELFINGEVPLNAVGWENLQAKIAGHMGSTNPFALAPVLSAKNLILLQDKPQGDVLTVAFTGVQQIAAPTCHDLVDFQKTILPVIQQSSCISCHNGGTPSGFNGSSQLLLNGTDAQVCAAVFERTDFVYSDASPFYLIGFLDENDHPPSVSPATTFSLSWEAWVAAEQDAGVPGFIKERTQ